MTNDTREGDTLRWQASRGVNAFTVGTRPAHKDWPPNTHYLSS
jgi:hypothetical protein